MAYSASLLNADTEFDRFLFAEIGQDKKGMVVSVISALARLDLDPWQKAADFAGLPENAAKAMLVDMIAKLPGMSPTLAAPNSVAERLVALLPAQTQATRGAGASSSGADAMVDARSKELVAWIVLLMVVLLGSQALIANQLPAPTSDSVLANTASPITKPSASPAQTAGGAGAPPSVFNADGRAQDAGRATKPAPARKPLFGR